MDERTSLEQRIAWLNTGVSGRGFQSNAFQGFQKTNIVSKTSPTRHVAFERAADAVKAMWDQLFCISQNLI